MREPTTDELLSLRRAARVLYGPLRDHATALLVAQLLNAIADDCDAPQLCEGCDNEGVYADDDGCYTCRECAGESTEENRELLEARAALEERAFEAGLYAGQVDRLRRELEALRGDLRGDADDSRAGMDHDHAKELDDIARSIDAILRGEP